MSRYQDIKTSVCLYVKTSKHQDISMSICQDIKTSVYLYVKTSRHQDISMSICQDIKTSRHQYVYMSRHQNICMSVCQDIKTSRHLFLLRFGAGCIIFIAVKKHLLLKANSSSSSFLPQPIPGLPPPP